MKTACSETRQLSVESHHVPPKCVSVTSDLADVDGGHLCGADRRVTRGVGQRLARPDGQLLLLPGGHDLLGDCKRQTHRHVNRTSTDTDTALHRPDHRMTSLSLFFLY